MAEAAQSSIPSAIPAKVQPEAAADDPSVFDDAFLWASKFRSPILTIHRRRLSEDWAKF